MILVFLVRLIDLLRNCGVLNLDERHWKEITEAVQSMSTSSDVITFMVDDYFIQVLYSEKPAPTQYTVVVFLYDSENSLGSKQTKQYEKTLISYLDMKNVPFEKKTGESEKDTWDEIWIELGSATKVANIIKGIFERVFHQQDYELQYDMPEKPSMKETLEIKSLMDFLKQYEKYKDKLLTCDKCGSTNVDYKTVKEKDKDTKKTVTYHIYTCKECGNAWHWRDDDN